MSNFITNTYEMKRDIVNFSNKLYKNSDKPETKFVTDMIYGISKSVDDNYNNLVMDTLGDTPVFLVDDSDIVKPLGEKFEDLCIIRDGSSRKKSYEKGYHHTEIVGLTKNMKQLISIFSKIDSSTQKDFISNNSVTYEGLDKVVSLLDERNLRKIYRNHKWYKITTLREAYKGNINQK